MVSGNFVLQNILVECRLGDWEPLSRGQDTRHNSCSFPRSCAFPNYMPATTAFHFCYEIDANDSSGIFSRILRI